jgi:putative RNA 2'-phosphotransferase
MTRKAEIKISKFLSLILRHKPETIGVQLDENGWLEVEVLLQQLAAKGRPLSKKDLDFIVENNPKKRFTYNENHSKIRANQGHSIQVDLGFSAQKPPSILYHGTGDRFVNAIKAKGLLKMNRQHVHLSTNIPTALQVGQRHGKPKLFKVDAASMYKAGYNFYLSKNGVWLTDVVPVEYLSIIKK